jgi:hypothetical protein
MEESFLVLAVGGPIAHLIGFRNPGGEISRPHKKALEE